MLNNITVDKITSRRTDVTVQMVALGWLPSWKINYNNTVNSYQTVIAAYRLPPSPEANKGQWAKELRWSSVVCLSSQ